MGKEQVTIDEIHDSLYDLDSEYGEALARALMDFNYVSDSPLNLSIGTKKQQEELKRVITKPLNEEEIKAIINHMMNEMKDDYQYNEFKPIALKYLDIAKRMSSKKNEKVAVKSGYYFEIFLKSEIPNTLEKSNKIVSLNSKMYDLYRGTSLEDERKIDEMFGDRMGYDIDEHLIRENEEQDEFE